MTVYDGPCMQWGAGVSVLASWGEGPESWWLVMVVKSVWLHRRHYLELDSNN